MFARSKTDPTSPSIPRTASFDILGHVAGIGDYNELRAEAVVTIVEDVEVRVASIDHLIAMKRAANRTKDKLMVEEYIVIADEQRRAGRG